MSRAKAQELIAFERSLLMKMDELVFPPSADGSEESPDDVAKLRNLVEGLLRSALLVLARAEHCLQQVTDEDIRQHTAEGDRVIKELMLGALQRRRIASFLEQANPANVEDLDVRWSGAEPLAPRHRQRPPRTGRHLPAR